MSDYEGLKYSLVPSMQETMFPWHNSKIITHTILMANQQRRRLTTLHNQTVSRAGDRGWDGTERNGMEWNGTTPATELHDAHTTESLQKCSASQHLNAHTHDVISCSWSQSSTARRTEGGRERKAVHNIACNKTYTSHRMNAKIDTNNTFTSRDVTIA